MLTRTRSIDIFVFMVVGFAISFFSPKALTEGSFNAIRLAVLLGTIIVSVTHLFSANYGLAKPIRWLFFAILCSSLGAYFSWGQTLLQSVQPMVPYAIWPFFFYLVHVKYPMEKVEKILMIYGVLYLLCYGYQYLHSGTVIFGNADEFDEDRGVTRIVFPGGPILFMAAVIALNKTTGYTRNKFFYIGFAGAALVATIMQVTRQSIAIIMLVYAYHILRRMNPVAKWISMACMVVGLLALLNTDNPIIRGLEEKQQETVEAGADYVRVAAGIYFLNDLSPDLLARIVGNGPPYKSATASSPLADRMTYMTQTFGYYVSDVGIIGFYAMFGLIAVIAYVLLFVKAFRIKVPEEYLYLKYYLFYILLTSLTSDSVDNPSSVVCLLFVLYGLQRCLRPMAAEDMEASNVNMKAGGAVSYA